MMQQGRTTRFLRRLGWIFLVLVVFAIFMVPIVGAASLSSHVLHAVLGSHRAPLIAALLIDFLLFLLAMRLAFVWSVRIVERLGKNWALAASDHETTSTPACSVLVTDEEIISSGARRPTEKVAWRDLTEVAIVNEDAFPIGWQYWLLIGTSGTGAIVPSDAEGAKELLEALQTRLPGFDNAAVIAAMGSVDGAFRVWRKPEPGGH